jgi:3',5'-cyclic AMP phosphodiesterase CpdA
VGTRRWPAVTLVLAAALAAACTGTPQAGDTSASATAPATASPAAGQRSTTLLAAGDIASCASDGDEQTAALLDSRPGTVLTLGDTVYDDGSADQFTRCYLPSWGRFRDRTYPAPGNHDYHTAAASGYYEFFGPRAGQPGKGWYSFDRGRWHLVALNSNCKKVGGCQPGSEQERWLRADLAAHPARCTLAFWHHPRFSSGTTHGSDPAVGGLWLALYEAGADVVLVGHEHNYERFAPLDPLGGVDPARGVREFVVGTGGKSHYRFGSPLPGSEARNSDSFGLLELQLRPTGYSWRFLPAQGGSFQDSGSASCH